MFENINKKYVLYGGVGLLSIGGLFLYRRNKSESTPPPVSEEPYSATDNLNFSTPAMMYSPSGGGLMGGASGDSLTSAGGAPSLSDILGSAGGSSVGQFISRASDTATLSTIALDAGETASISHGINGSSLTIKSAPPNYSATEIRQYISAQESAGVPINAAYIQQAAKDKNVDINTIGAAYGFDAEGTQAWLKANPSTQVKTTKAYSGDEIKAFIANKEKSGQKVSAANIKQWAAETGADINAVGAAYNMDSAQTQAWLAAN